MREIENFHCEKEVEQWYYKTIKSSNVHVFNKYPSDGVIHIKDKNIYGILETKFERTKRITDMISFRQAFIQAIWYTFQFSYCFEFFIIGSQKHFGIFYLKDYNDFIDYLRHEYEQHNYTASEAKKIYCNHICFRILDLKYHDIQQKIKQLQKCF